jgi:glycosyltransferase involved in cell wall biosynthesis
VNSVATSRSSGPLAPPCLASSCLDVVEQGAAAVKVLNVIGSLNPLSGGPPSSAQNVWIASQRAGVQVSVAVTMEDPPLPSEAAPLGRLRDQGIRIQVFPYARWPARLSRRWGISLSLAAWLLKEARNYDVVHLHSAWMFSSLVGLLAAKLAGTRVVLMPHESITRFDVAKGTFFKSWAKRAIKLAYGRFLDAIIFSSELELRDSMAPGMRPRAVALHHPVYDDLQFVPPARRRRATPGQLVVGYLGRLDPKKNIELLLTAISQLPETVSLRVAGDGHLRYREQLHKLAERLGVAGRVEWVGFIGAEARDAFFETIDVLAMPSTYECFGMVAAEATIHRVPTVVTTISGIAEVIGAHGCGMVVPPATEAVRHALSELLEAPDRLDEMAERSRTAAEEGLSFASYGPKLARLYTDVATPSPRLLPRAA